MSNNIRRNLNAAIAAYANGIAIRRNMPNGHPRKAELNRELKKTLLYKESRGQPRHAAGGDRALEHPGARQ